MGKYLNKYFSKKNIQINRHEKMLNISNHQRNQMKTTMEYHLTPARMTRINKSTKNKCWQECGGKGTFMHCWWECRLVQPLWKTVWNFLRKLKMELSTYLVILFWEYFWRNPKHYFERIYVPMYSLQHYLQ